MKPIAIEQNNKSGEVSYWQGQDHQSHADRHGVSLASYIHALYGFLRQAKARKVLMIGCGGGTLATMLRRAGVEVVIVDVAAASFQIARRYFHLPVDVECHIADGVKFLRQTSAKYDAIVLDAFFDDKIPRPFWKAGFFALAKKRLRRGGVFLVNITVQDDDDSTPDRFCKLMRTAWRTVRLLDTDGYIDRNAVGLAGAVGTFKPPKLLMRPRQRARGLERELLGLEFRDLR